MGPIAVMYGPIAAVQINVASSQASIAAAGEMLRTINSTKESKSL